MSRACTFAATAAALAACGNPPAVDPTRAAELYAEVVVDTAPGLSGLAADDTGALWTVAERAARAYRIVLDAELRRPTAVETLAVEGVPADTDLEGIATLGGDRFALGTEGHVDGVATVLLAERRSPTTLAVTRTIELPADRAGIAIAQNQGAEGVCGAGDLVFAAIEGAGTTGARRWAPLLRVTTAGAIERTYRVTLTTPTGKLSALDCRRAADGSFRAIAIERHFEVTKLVAFSLPPPGTGSDDIEPTVVLDLGPVLAGRLNLEGLAELPSGRIVAAVDNQWKTITGPSELLVFHAATRAPQP